MSTIGAKAQWMPVARASEAATAWASSIVSGDQDAASAIGTGATVRRPWMTSNPKMSGMPHRLPSIASFCSRLIWFASRRNSSDPTRPRASSASTAPVCAAPASLLDSGLSTTSEGSPPVM